MLIYVFYFCVFLGVALLFEVRPVFIVGSAQDGVGVMAAGVPPLAGALIRKKRSST